jgi:hypothetical protein
VNSAPRTAPKCSRSRGTLFTLPWNPCSRFRGNPVHHRVEYAISPEYPRIEVIEFRMSREFALCAPCEDINRLMKNPVIEASDSL